MNEQHVDDLKARLDYLEAAMAITRTNGYLPYAELVRAMPSGPPPEVMEFVEISGCLAESVHLGCVRSS